MHLTELSSSHTGSRGRRGRSAGLGHDAYNTRSLPRHFKLSTHQQGAAQSYYDATKDTLYVSKSIALICQLPYVHAACKFLTGLHRWVLHLMTWYIQGFWVVMLCCRFVVPGVSEDHTAFILKGLGFQVVDPWRWRHYSLSKHQGPLTHQHRFTSQKTWLL
jgi:hypothetical protein